MFFKLRKIRGVKEKIRFRGTFFKNKNELVYINLWNDIDAHQPLAPIADNRLRGPQGEFEAQYHYDALGRRSRKAVRYKGKTEQTTRFLWQGYRLLQEQRDDGSRRSWSYDPASPWSPLAALEQAGDSHSADIYWYHTDLNSAPLEVTDAAGNLCWSGQYDTFGKLQGQTVAGAAKRQGAQYQQPLRYTGQYQDDESGLHLQPVPLLRTRGGAFHHAGSDRASWRAKPVSVCAEPADVGGSVWAFQPTK
ncbi:hypothetical protein SMQC13_17180 [Serratia marcescens]|nr:hypothetical protein SMQC13_17180 [Serratia marcescens]